ncbi:protein kinase [Streptomyces muensis]|uniref:Protein kinase n=1 Tax=Streptomyces muensis TaxID=1077944 RepID=A0A9X1Q8F7_STRM4|nr:protein kinase [Streptomyces muensis]MCF1599809.1 protein kinase [Streptomyces muensis]
MDDYAGRVLADRYRLPLPPSDEYELTETRAFDTYSGQEVLVRQVPLPEVVEAEVLDAEGLPDGFTARETRERGSGRRSSSRASTRRPSDPAVRRAVEAAQAAARIPDHPRLDQVFDVFAEGGSLWIVSEFVAARPLAALLAEKPLTPYRAAEVASDVLMALRVLHAHGWVHRNITARTVLVCDDGRVMLTGLAVGAAEEALCGYDPVPAEDGDRDGSGDAVSGTPDGGPGGAGAAVPPGPRAGESAIDGPGAAGADPEAARRAAIEARAAGALPVPGAEASGGAPRGALETGGDIRAARAGAIAAYRAGARAAARVQETQQNGRAALPGARPAPENGPAALTDGAAQQPYGTATPPGRIADPYGVQAPSWPGAGGLPAQGAPGAPGSSARGVPAEVPASHPPARWDDLVTGAPVRRGPTTALAAERARQARMAVVGPVTERWAPEQAGPVHENWQLAAPIGPATDLWALGALLFRAVQGHAPYPEESTAELVQMVCAEPPAFAEECGPLRPVVESLLRQDPTERLDFEELRGWLRSLVRSAPEPEAGTHVVAAPPVDPNRLPIVRRRGELVRRRRAGLPAHHGRHKRARREVEHSPRRLGRTLLVLVLLGMAAAIAYAMLFMPKADQGDGAPADAGRTGAAGQAGAAEPEQSAEASSEPRPEQTSPGSGNDPSESAGSTETQTNSPDDPDVPDGFTLRKDEAGFRIAVANGWNRTPENGRGQVVYSHGDFDLIVVAGRDTADRYGSDPMVYQREHEGELQPYRDSSWASSGGLKTIQVGERVMAEGQFTWTDDQGRELFVRNVAMLIDGRYHVVQVRGPEAERDEVTRLFEQASATYQVTG